ATAVPKREKHHVPGGRSTCLAVPFRVDENRIGDDLDAVFNEAAVFEFCAVEVNTDREVIAGLEFSNLFGRLRKKTDRDRYRFALQLSGPSFPDEGCLE